MIKMSYADQLKHPNWQRKRLETLAKRGFQCEACESTEKTLHVHHRLYIRGRMAWEYEDDQLAVLCEDCHKAEHEARGALDEEIGRLFGIADLWEVHALLVGRRNGLVESEGVPAEYADSKIGAGEDCSKAYWLGQIVHALSEHTDEAVGDTYMLLQANDGDAFVDAVRAELERLGQKLAP